MGAFSNLLVVVCAAVAQVSSTAPTAPESYHAVLHAQYSAHSTPAAQRAEEAKRVYDAYLNSIGEKSKIKSEDSSGSAGDSSH